jgi:hypothetical protein
MACSNCLKIRAQVKRVLQNVGRTLIRPLPDQIRGIKRDNRGSSHAIPRRRYSEWRS